MKVRRPNIDFAASLPHWAKNHEFAQIFNAASTTLPHIEPYLNNVMRQAKSRLADSDESLKKDILLFVRQESNHYQQHKLYNATLYRTGYEGILAHEKKLSDDFARFLSAKSFKFNCAYCEGFESLGIIYAEFFYERIADLLAGADQNVVGLWKWHLAEEFEHRTVCFDVYRRLFGGYLYRVYGLIFAFIHLGLYGAKASKYLLTADRAAMSRSERFRSSRRAMRYQMRLSAFALPRVLRILSPFYDPRRRRTPEGSADFLRGIEARS